jgi:hypothetical protein
LTVAPRVLVAVAAGELEVLVHARDHEDLLVQLGRLRQSVELARIQARGHEVVAGALGRRFYEGRSLDLPKTLADEILARREGDLVSKLDFSLHREGAQVEIAVFEPEFFLGVGLLVDHEGEGLAARENVDRLGEDFDLARLHIFIDHIVGPRTYDAAHRDAVFELEF